MKITWTGRHGVSFEISSLRTVVISASRHPTRTTACDTSIIFTDWHAHVHAYGNNNTLKFAAQQFHCFLCLLSSETQAAIHYYKEHSRHNGTYKKAIKMPKVESSFTKVNILYYRFLFTTIRSYRRAFSPTHALQNGYTQWGCVGWQQCMPALLLLLHVIQNPLALFFCYLAARLANNSKQLNCIVGIVNC